VQGTDTRIGIGEIKAWQVVLNALGQDKGGSWELVSTQVVSDKGWPNGTVFFLKRPH
jgi:hypothetical protein